MDYWIQLEIKDKPVLDKAQEAVVPENWMQESNPLLFDVPVDDIDPLHKDTKVIPVDQLKIQKRDEVYVIEVEGKEIPLAQGDVLEYKNTHVHVHYIYPVSTRHSAIFDREDESGVALFPLGEGEKESKNSNIFLSTQTDAFNGGQLNQPSVSTEYGALDFLSDGHSEVDRHMGQHLSLSPLGQANDLNLIPQPAFNLPKYKERGDSFDRADKSASPNTAALLTGLPGVGHERQDEGDLSEISGLSSQRPIDDIESLFFDSSVGQGGQSPRSKQRHGERSGLLAWVKQSLMNNRD